VQLLGSLEETHRTDIVPADDKSGRVVEVVPRPLRSGSDQSGGRDQAATQRCQTEGHGAAYAAVGTYQPQTDATSHSSVGSGS